MPSRITSSLQSLFVPLLGIGAIFILVFVFIIPAQHQLDEIQNDMQEYDQQIDDQQAALDLVEEKLASVHESRTKQRDQAEQLQTELKALQTKLGEITPFSLPEITPFPKPVHMLPKMLEEMAGSHELTNIAVDLQHAGSFQDRPNSVSRIAAAGSLHDIRDFLIQLLETPYVAALNQIELTNCRDRICLDLQLSVSL